MAEERCADGREKSPQRAEGLVDRRRFVTAVNHAIGALRVSARVAVIFPVRSFEQFLKRVAVSVLQQVTRFLPTENIVRGIPPRRALQVPVAAEKLQKQRRLIENPALFSIAEYSPK